MPRVSTNRNPQARLQQRINQQVAAAQVLQASNSAVVEERVNSAVVNVDLSENNQSFKTAIRHLQDQIDYINPK